MGIRHYKPTTPGRRRARCSDFAEITDRKKKPEKSLLRPSPRKGGRNNQGIVTHALPWRRPQADVPHHRLQAPQGQRLGHGGVDRIRSEPLGAHRPAAVRGRRQGVHPGAGRAEGGRQGAQRRRRRAARRQLPAAAEDSARHDRSQRRNAAGPRRPDLPQRRHQRDLDRPRRRLGPDHAAVGRSAPHQLRVPGDDRRRSATPTT